jgi:hypothetical protein
LALLAARSCRKNYCGRAADAWSPDRPGAEAGELRTDLLPIAWK